MLSLDDDQLQEWRHLTLSHGSMWGTIQQYRSGTKKRADECMLYLLRNEEGTPIAWAFIFPAWYPEEMNYYTFTREDERRKGHGKALYERAVKEYAKVDKKMKVHPWDPRSHGFYDSVV